MLTNALINKKLFALTAFVLALFVGPVYPGPFEEGGLFDVERSSSSVSQPAPEATSNFVVADENPDEFEQKLYPADQSAITPRDMTQICFESYLGKDDDSVLPKHFEKIHELKDDSSGFQAIACINKITGKLVVCYTGTSGPNDVVADLGIIGIGFARLNVQKELLSKKLRFEEKIEQAKEKIRTLEISGNKAKALWYIAQKQLFKAKVSNLENRISKIRKEIMVKLHKNGMTNNKKLKKQVEQSRQFFNDSMDIYKKVKPENKDESVAITGHSLGGFLAQVVGAKTGHTTITFNAPGAQGFFPEIKSSKNICNYIRKSDIVGNFGTHIGQTEVMPDSTGSKLNPAYIFKNHGLGSMVNDF